MNFKRKEVDLQIDCFSVDIEKGLADCAEFNRRKLLYSQWSVASTIPDSFRPSLNSEFAPDGLNITGIVYTNSYSLSSAVKPENPVLPKVKNKILVISKRALTF